MHQQREKEILFSPSHQVMSGRFQGSRASAEIMVAPEGKHSKQLMPRLPPPFLAFVSISADIIWHGFSLSNLAQQY